MPPTVNYSPLPYVRGNTVGELLRLRGQRAAESELRRGDITAQMFARLGEQISNSVNSYAQQKREEPIRAQEAQQRDLAIQQSQGAIGAQQQAARDRGALDTALSVPDRATALSMVPGHLRPDVEKHFMDLDEGAAKLKTARAAADEAEANYWGRIAVKVKPYLAGEDGGLGAVQIALAHAKEQGYSDADQYLQQVTKDPTQLPTIVDTLIQASPEQRKLLGEESDRKLEQTQEERALQTAKDAAADRAADNARGDATLKATIDHNKAMEARPVAGAQPSFQAKEVLNDDGKPVLANYDARSGVTKDSAGNVIKNPRPVPSAMEQMDSRKFEKSAPVLKSINELSERINVNSGLIAKMTGGAKKAAVKANYDDDVAEYQALISGFTPLVARSLGHTGVLTQQDVDSVKELFPKPGDSKTLRDRKLKRMETIMGGLEGTERGTSTGVPQVGGTFNGGKVLKVEKVQ